jgi:hypothetical protein
MDSRLDFLEQRVKELTRQVQEIQEHLSMLESQSPAERRDEAYPSRAPFVSPMAEPVSGEGTARAVPGGTVALVGRTLIVLGGGFLLRALTDAELLPPLVGALLGLVYAAFWLFLSRLADKRNERVNAAFHGFAAIFIAYPLIWETTTRLQIFSPATGAALLLGFYALGQGVIWRCKLPEIAWSNTLLAAGVSFGLFFATHALMPTTIALLAVASATEAMALRGRCLGLRWVAGFAIILAVLAIIDMVTRHEGLLPGYTVVSTTAAFLVALMLPAVYVVSVAVRTLLMNHKVSAFEIVQVSLALLIGLGGGVHLAKSAGFSADGIRVLAALLGAGAYGVGFAFVDRRAGRGRNFYFYTTLAAVLTLAGSWMILQAPTLTWCWSALGIAALFIGVSQDRITLRSHGVAYLTAAVAVSGLLPFAYDKLMGNPVGLWRAATASDFAVAAVVTLGYGLLVAKERRLLAWPGLLPRTVLAGFLVWIFAGLFILWLSAGLANAPGSDMDMAMLSTSRTLVLSCMAVMMALAARRYSLREMGWLVYPLLVGQGLRVLLEDIRYGSPSTLFLTLGLYGGALVATSRLMRKTPQSVTARAAKSPER